ncbi:MAG TPA: oligosaccharide flippase family protein, partial [Solirubrobacteraceae bacterium]
MLDATTGTSAADGAEEHPTEPAQALGGGRNIDTGGRSLRVHTARGVMVNGAFDVGLSSLSLIRGFILAAFLTRADYGVWGVLLVSLGVLAQLKLVGIGDKFVQQDEPDQELAFQRAFTLELLMTGATIVPMLLALPVIAIVYGYWKLIPPGLVLITTLVAYAFQAPFWVYYRDMNFLKQRRLSAIEPIVGFVLAIGLAIAGFGYWAIAIGLGAGAWAGTIAAIRTSPFKLRWRYDHATMRLYATYSGPLFIATASNVVLANAMTIATNAQLGLAGVGAVALAANITAFTTRVDDLVSTTLYPAICAVQDRIDLLRESFVKSNRIALMWAMPFGVGLALFAGDLVRFGIGEKWHPVIILLQITGVIAAISQVGFNWDDYFRARSNTRPVAIAGVAATVALLGAGLPLLFTDGLPGLAIGTGVGAAVHLAFRGWYLSKLFEDFGIVRHALRAALPTLVGVAAVLALRAVETGARSFGLALAELVAYGVVI